MQIVWFQSRIVVKKLKLFRSAFFLHFHFCTEIHAVVAFLPQPINEKKKKEITRKSFGPVHAKKTIKPKRNDRKNGTHTKLDGKRKKKWMKPTNDSHSHSKNVILFANTNKWRNSPKVFHSYRYSTLATFYSTVSLLFIHFLAFYSCPILGNQILFFFLYLFKFAFRFSVFFLFVFVFNFCRNANSLQQLHQKISYLAMNRNQFSE